MTEISFYEAEALNNKGFELANLDRYEEALAAHNELITRFANSQDLTIQQLVADAFFLGKI